MPGGSQGDEVIRSVGKRRVRITGRFFPQGAGAIVNASNIGKAGWTVARTGVGLYLVTLDRRFLKLVLGSIDVQLAAPAARSACWGAITSTSTGHTIPIAIFDNAGAAAEIAANADNSVSFDIEACQDTVIG